VLHTTRTIHDLLWNGTFGKFPNIRGIMPHGGGTVPFLIYRMSAMNNNPRVAAKLPGGSVASALRLLHYDSGMQCARTAEMSDGDCGLLPGAIRQRLSILTASNSEGRRQIPHPSTRAVCRLGRGDMAINRERQCVEAFSAIGEGYLTKIGRSRLADISDAARRPQSREV
jgi:hypothetical protein